MTKVLKSLFVVALGAWLAWQAWGPYRAHAKDADIAVPLAEIQKEWRTGDLVVVQPRRLALDLVGVTGVPAVGGAADRYMDLSGFSRVFIVHPAGRLATPTFRNELSYLGRQKYGALAVSRYEVRYRGDRDAAAAMTVALVAADGVEKPCARRGDGTFFCGPKEWNFVGLHKTKAGDIEEVCIWAHPQQAAATRITLPDGPRSGEVRIHAQLADSAASDEKLPPVKLTVRSGGSAYEMSKGGGKGLDTRTFRVGPGVPFAIDVATAQESRQHFCFHIEW